MNRAERRALKAVSRELAANRPAHLTEIPQSDWPPPRGNAPRPLRCWQSQKYLVQLYEAPPTDAARFRLTVCRVTLNAQGRWDDQLAWEELQAVKREVGFGSWYAVEVYPPDQHIVNVANMRHLWLCEKPLQIGWLEGDDE